MTNFPSSKDLEEVRNRLNESVASRPLPVDASPVDRAKFKICEQFVIFKNKSGMTQRALAEKIEIDEALMSKILHYNFNEFTTDRLINYLSKIFSDIDVRIHVA